MSSIPDALLPTVRSRCPRLRFGPLSAAEVAQALVRDHGYSEADARAAAADADGSIGRALSADSADLTQARDEARRLLEQTAQTRGSGASSGRGQGSRAAPRGRPPSDRDQMAACLRALPRCCAISGSWRRRRDRRDAGQCRPEPQLEKLTGAFDHRRSLRRMPRSTRRSLPSSATRARRSWPTGWCCSCSQPSRVIPAARVCPSAKGRD